MKHKTISKVPQGKKAEKSWFDVYRRTTLRHPVDNLQTATHALKYGNDALLLYLFLCVCEQWQDQIRKAEFSDFHKANFGTKDGVQ